MAKICWLLSILFALNSIASAQTKSAKKGIAYGYLSEADMAAISPGLSWWYNWSDHPESAVAGVFPNYHMDFVPMAWNGAFNEYSLRMFYAAHPTAKYLLGFNEPNFTTQANMTPSQAAAAWPALENIARDYGLKIVGPAVNYCDKCVTVNGVTLSTTFQYLDAFFAACPSCKVDYLAVHNYMCYSGALSDYIGQFKKYNRKIWLTEYACWDQPTITLDMQKSLMIGSLDYLESDTMVFRYSWFTGDRSGNYPYLDIFKPSSGELTDLGKLYVNYSPVHDTSKYTLLPARIEAENYTTMSGIALQLTTDVDGVVNVGWIDAGDWLSYNVEVPETAEYTISFRVASASVTAFFDLKENGQTLASASTPPTGGWQTWQTVQADKITLTKGRHKLQLYSVNGGVNVNWLEFKAAQGSTNGIHETAQSAFSVYPNPLVNRIYIKLPPSHKETIARVIDPTGKLLKQKMFTANDDLPELDLSDLPNGLYILQLVNQGVPVSKIIVKNAL